MDGMMVAVSLQATPIGIRRLTHIDTQEIVCVAKKRWRRSFYLSVSSIVLSSEQVRQSFHEPCAQLIRSETRTLTVHRNESLYELKDWAAKRGVRRALLHPRSRHDPMIAPSAVRPTIARSFAHQWGPTNSRKPNSLSHAKTVVVSSRECCLWLEFPSRRGGKKPVK